MGSHAFKKNLIHRAVFLGRGTARSNTGEVTYTWTPISNGSSGTVDGRFVHRSHGVASPGQGFMMAHEHLWLCDSSAGVEEEQRVRTVVDSGGTAIREAAGTWRIESLIPRRTTSLHHYELTLEKVE